MPTGYTSAVADGEITTLRDFAMLCARGMGACITMRDEPFTAPIPERFEPSLSYHDPQLAAAQALLAELPLLSDEECERRAVAERDVELRSRTEYAERKKLQYRRYSDLLQQVEVWTCAAEGLREFMLSQLRESIQFDCSPDRGDRPAIELLSAQEWRERATAKAARDVAYHSEHIAKEYERVASRNQWLKALRDSLPGDDKSSGEPLLGSERSDEGQAPRDTLNTHLPHESKSPDHG